MKQDAEISSNKRYRYVLTRIWNGALPTLLFIGLNPSTADAQEDDATIRRLISLTRNWKHYGGF
jgi:hypothetical protein